MTPTQTASLMNFIGQPGGTNGGNGIGGPATVPNSNGTVQDASTQNTGGTSGGSSSTSSGPTPAETQLLNTVQNLVNSINGQYQALYGTAAGGTGAGSYGTGIQGAENLLQSAVLPQYQQVGNQANQMSQALDWANLANGTGISSYAGQQQQNLAANAQNAAAGITSNYQNSLYGLQQKVANQQAQDIQAQKGMNSELGTLQTMLPNMDPSTAAYLMTNTIGQLNNQATTLAGEQSQAQSPQQLYGQMQQIAPMQVMTPQAIGTALQGIGQSSLPNYLQAPLQNGLAQAAGGVPGGATDWTAYLQNLANPYSAS